MFKHMSNREFSDWLADEAMVQDSDPPCPRLAAALREASQRIKSGAEYQFDVRVTPHSDNTPV